MNPSPMLLQKQIRENAEDLHNYMLDLKSWESEMKRKESELKAEKSDVIKSDSVGVGLPPVRSKKTKSEKKRIKPTEDAHAHVSQTGAVTKKIAGFDYASWDRFDVDKACNEVDETSEESEEESDSEEEIVDDERLREEALYEKEKGNQLVRKQKWSEAIQCYSRAIECFPHDAIYYANRALCYLKTNKLESAEADCTLSLQLDSNYVKAYQRRAAARMGLGLLLEAKVDLQTVLELEPMNTASKVELIKLVKLIECSKPKNLDLTSTTKHADNLPLPQQSNVGSGEPVNVRMSWGSEDGIKLVQPINKPPHLRSKKPLKRILIQEIGEGATTTISLASKNIQEIFSRPEELKNMNQVPEDINRVRHKDTDTHYELSYKADETTHTMSSPVEPVIHKVQEKESVRQLTENDDHVPGRPRSSVEFLVGWKKIRLNPKLAFIYLNQIPGGDIPKIFQESFESATFTEIIRILETEFLKNSVPVYPYLLGISKVKRLSALTMFMSNADKAGLNKLLESCVSVGECNQDEAKIMKQKFEL